MSTVQREITRQAPPPEGVKIADDDRTLTRWLWNAGAPISLAEMSGSRFVGKFENDLLPAKRLVSFEPGMARSLGLYEHPAFVGTQSDMMASYADSMLSVPTAGINPATGQLSSSPLTRYNNNPKLCAYMLMRDNQTRGLCLFEDLKGVDDEEITFLFDLIIPPAEEAKWAQTKRMALEYEFQGPFLSQYKDWLGKAGNSPMKTWFNANIRDLAPEGLERKESDRLSSMVRDLRLAVDKAWSWENAALNSSEQQIRRYRNGKLGKEFYDMPDERFPDAPPPLDLLCLVDTNRQPIDLQQLAAADALNKGTQDGMVAAMESLGEKIADRMQPGVSAADIEAIIERRLAAQQAQWEEEKAEWQAKIDALKSESES